MNRFCTLPFRPIRLAALGITTTVLATPGLAAAISSEAAFTSRSLAPIARAQDSRPEPLGVDARFDQDYGAMVITNVVPNSLAAKSGLRSGDVVGGGLDASGREVDLSGGLDAFGRLVSMQRFTLLVYREGVAEEEPMKIAVDRGTAGRRIEGGNHDDQRRNGGDGGDSRPTSSANTLVLEKRSFQDPTLGMTSHTMLVPKGWSAQVQPLWTPTETAFLHTIGRVSGQDQELTYDRGRFFMYTEDPMMVQALRQQGPQAMQNFVRPPSRPGETTLLVLMPALRPQAENVQVIEAKRLPEIERFMNEMLAPTTQAAAQSGMQNFLAVEEARLRYRENGRSYDESFFYFVQISTLPNLMGGPPTRNWMVAATRSVRAPSDVFEKRVKDLTMLSMTLQPTPRWGIVSGKLQQQLSAIRHKGNMDRLRIMQNSSREVARINSEITDSQMASWKRQQADRDAGHRAYTNSILEVNDFKSRDGDSIQLSNAYDRVFQDPLGNVILTNDASYDPTTDMGLKTNDWQQLQQLGR
ncbi:MAG: hypothetical protein H6833_11235 [Planctomycetes bacterium]|nr:hypothetical protein [Planctomycetota bacterium]